MSLCDDEIALKICRILSDADKECYLVGGSVRDDLLDEKPSDYDFATNATPDETTEIFKESGCKVVPTGIKHGTVTVFCDGDEAEITTYRIEGKYSDGRRPDYVKFTNDIEDDLSRRDITINAMALNPIKCSLIDPFGGREDLRNGIIRAVRNAQDRFNEDGLRPIRVARFAAKLGFRIHKETFAAMKTEQTHDVAKRVAGERVRDEFLKAFLTERPESFVNILKETGLLWL